MPETNPQAQPGSVPAPGGDLQAFLDEGHEVVVALAAAAGDLEGEEASGAAEAMALLAHRLYGSAALYGVNEVAALAEALERALGGIATTEEGPGASSALLREAVEALEWSLARAGVADASSLDEDPPGLGQERTGLDEEGGDLLERLLALAPEEEDHLSRWLEDYLETHADVVGFFRPEVQEKAEELGAAVAAMAAEIAGGGGGQSGLEGVQRVVHNLKGTAYMVECEPIGDLGHLVEDLLLPVTEGRLEVKGPVLGALEDAVDVLLRFLAVFDGRDTRTEAPFRALKKKVRRLTGGEEPVGEARKQEAPRRALLRDETAGRPQDRSPASGDRASRPFAASIRVDLDRIDALMGLVGEMVVSRGRLGFHHERLAEVRDLVGRSHERLARVAEQVEAGSLRREEGSGRAEREVGQLLRGPWQGALRGEGPAGDDGSDLGLDRFGGLALLGRQLAEISFDVRESLAELDTLRRELGRELESAGKLLRGVRTAVGRTRLQPLSLLFRRFEQRVARFARERGRQVRLEVQGEQVEVDTAVVERLADPLLHLVTNALVHGVESPQERRAGGKAEEALLALRAHLRGAFVEIEVEDDGPGLSPTRLRKRAVELGFLAREEAESLSDPEALELIFRPGFSTAREVTATAGRGIGMDAVASAVAELKGQIRTETEAGLGTRFTLRLPVGLVVSSVLHLRVGRQTFALPALNAHRLLEVPLSRLEKRQGREWIRDEEEEVEVIRLAESLGVSDDRRGAAPPERRPLRGPETVALVFVQAAPTREIALAVDELLGLEEVVVQGLGEFLDGLPGFGGVTRRPDGSVLLVLDVTTLPGLTSGSARRPVQRPSSSPAPAAEERRRRILLADDSFSVRQVLGRRLQAAGFEVVTVEDGDRALERLREPGRRPFDALVTDLEMPHLNGFELLAILRRRPETRDLPIIVVTTRAGEKHREHASRLGASGYFGKPVDFEALLGTLQELTAPAGNERKRP